MNTTMKINDKKYTIEITKTFAQKASRVGTPEYHELLEVRRNFPKYKVVIQKAASKDSYKGLTYAYMEKYIKAHDDETGSLMAEFKELRGKDDDGEEAMAESLSYGEIKMWFLAAFPEVKKFHEDRADRIKKIKEANKKAAAEKAKKAA